MAGKFDKGKCGYCGKLQRRMFEIGKSNKARLQHPRWVVCENGHKQMKKKGQKG
jgi:hypothetical protein